MGYKHLLLFVVFLNYGVYSAHSIKKPNILFILADDFGFNDIGYHGSEIKTPTLDNLATSGVRLENYYVQPICSPTRSQLLSGRYQIHTGLQHSVIRPPQENGLPLDDPTMADKLKEAGYATHAIGKWHLGFYKKEYLPTYRGFDTYYGYLVGQEDYFKHYACYENMCGFDLRNGLDPVTNASGIYSTHLFATRAIDIVNNHDKEEVKEEEPFPTATVPLPAVPICSCTTPSSRAGYLKPYASIKDRSRRTYADNGGQVTEGGNNFPLRGWKGSLWEGGIHGVGFVSGPVLDENVRGTVSRGLFHVSDWFPTVIKLAGGNLNGTLPLDGFDQWNTINGFQSPRTEILHNIDSLTAPSGSPRKDSPFDTTIRAALRVDHWKIITGDPGNSSWVPPPSQESFNRISSPDVAQKNVWLFNITADPKEHNDLSQQYPDVVDSLLKRLRAYQETAVPCSYPPTDRRADPKLHGGFWGPWEQ